MSRTEVSMTLAVTMLFGCAGRGTEMASPIASMASNISGEKVPVIRAGLCKKPDAADVNLKWKGTVVLALLVSAEGKITAGKIVKSTGDPDADRYAFYVVGTCTAVPGTRDGVAVEMWATLKFRFAGE